MASDSRKERTRPKLAKQSRSTPGRVAGGTNEAATTTTTTTTATKSKQRHKVHRGEVKEAGRRTTSHGDDQTTTTTTTTTSATSSPRRQHTKKMSLSMLSPIGEGREPKGSRSSADSGGGGGVPEGFAQPKAVQSLRKQERGRKVSYTGKILSVLCIVIELVQFIMIFRV